MNDLKDKIYGFCVTGAGTGFLPLMPGTWASVMAVLLAFILQRIWGLTITNALLAAGIGLCCILGLILCPWAEEKYDSKDPRFFVLDEMAGQWLTVLGFGLYAADPIAILAGSFVAFRFFDIAKPPPIRELENLADGWGVMADDLLAGLYGILTGWLVFILAF